MERNYKVLIIDDEEGAIENLILCLKRYRPKTERVE